MKVRMGFISNSSSSSFVVAVPKDVKAMDSIKKAFELPKGHPLTQLAEKIIEQIAVEVDGTNYIEDLEAFCDEYDIDPNEDNSDFPLTEKVIKAFKKGWKVYQGEFYDDNDIDLTGVEFDVDNDDIILLSNQS
jgi:hypothetical protein